MTTSESKDTQRFTPTGRGSNLPTIQGENTMETKIIDLCVKLLAARLTEDREDIGGYEHDKKSDEYRFYAFKKYLQSF